MMPSDTRDIGVGESYIASFLFTVFSRDSDNVAEDRGCLGIGKMGEGHSKPD